MLLWHKDQISRWLSWKRYSERLVRLHDITAPLEQSSLPHLGFISQKWFTLQPLLDYSLCKLQNHSPNRQCQDPCFVYYTLLTAPILLLSAEKPKDYSAGYFDYMVWNTVLANWWDWCVLYRWYQISKHQVCEAQRYSITAVCTHQYAIEIVYRARPILSLGGSWGRGVAASERIGLAR